MKPASFLFGECELLKTSEILLEYGEGVYYRVIRQKAQSATKAACYKEKQLLHDSHANMHSANTNRTELPQPGSGLDKHVLLPKHLKHNTAKQKGHSG